MTDRESIVAMLRKQASFTAAEQRGMVLFQDPAPANRAGCHVVIAANMPPPSISDQSTTKPKLPALFANTSHDTTKRDSNQPTQKITRNSTANGKTSSHGGKSWARMARAINP